MAFPFPLRYLAIAAFVALVLISFVTLHGTDSGENIRTVLGKGGPSKSSPTTKPSILSPPLTEEWKFDVNRDGDNYGLTDHQCDSAFPKLFVEIEKSVALRKDNHITFEELDSRPVTDGMVRAIVHDGEVCISNKLEIPRD